jgi:hypothetical protein
VTGERERIRCEKGHACNGWLIVDSGDNWVGNGFKEQDGEVFTIARSLPPKTREKPKRKRLPIPLRTCLYGHMDWISFVDQSGATRYRCNTCQTRSFRKLKKKGLVRKIV